MFLGNLGEVYNAVRVGDLVGYGDSRPLDAEMVTGTTPKWHAWETLPGHEQIFASHLSGPWFQASGGTSVKDWNKYELPPKVRHGSMRVISRKDYDALVEHFGI